MKTRFLLLLPPLLLLGACNAGLGGPPFSQAGLASAVVLTLSHAEEDTFTTLLFNLDDLDDYVATAAQQDTSSTLQTWAEAQRADWPLYRDQMKQAFIEVRRKGDALGLDWHRLKYVGFSADDRHIDPATGRIFFGQFSIYLTDGKTPCTLECAMLRQTATGWKLSGDTMALVPGGEPQEVGDPYPHGQFKPKKR